MDSSDVNIGEKYEAKLSGKLVPVQVIGEHLLYDGRQEFDVTDLATGRTVLLRGAGRLRPMPALIQFFLTVNSETKEITRKKAVDTVIRCVGPGKWLDCLHLAGTNDGLMIPGIGRLHKRKSA